MNKEVGKWGPAGKGAALSITFDNFGEAGEIAFGILPQDTAHGRHDTATAILPRLADLLDDINITYFIEGINAQIYPNELRSIQNAGHEIALHAWQHESWNRLRLESQETLLRKSLSAMRAIGIHPEGFRPPGGEISPDSLALLGRAGLTYCSPLGSGQSRVQENMAVLPFQWRHVDAYLMDPTLNDFRAGNAASGLPLEPSQWADILFEALARALASGQHLTIIFHPYMFGRSTDQWRVLRDFLKYVRSLQSDLWVARCCEVADWLRRSFIQAESGSIQRAF